jgi:hypothetical protein
MIKKVKLVQLQYGDYVACAGIFKQSMWARNRVGIGIVVPARQATQPGGISSLESILRLLKSLKIRALACLYDNPIPTRFLYPH